MSLRYRLFDYLLRKSNRQERAHYSLELDRHNEKVKQAECDHGGHDTIKIVGSGDSYSLILDCKKCGKSRGFDRKALLNSK